MFNKELWTSTFTFIGLIIGAGIFAIPYVVAKAGFLTGLFDIIIISLILIYVCLCLGEVVLRTKGKHQLTGLAEKYLGKEGKLILFVSILVSMYGALIAYSIGSGQALASLTNLNPKLSSLIFLGVMSVVIAFKLKFFAMFESIFTPIKIIMILLIIAITLPHINSENLSKFNIHLVQIPYGVLLFALTGFSVIPDMAREIKNKKVLKKSIILGILISAIIYILFALAVVGTLGKDTSQLSTIALGEKLGSYMILLANIFALLAMSTAFVAVGFCLKENFNLDYKIKPLLAWFLVIIIPIMFIIIGKFNFVKIIDVSGILGTGITLLSILVMHSRSIKQGNKKPAFKIKNYKIVKGLIILLIAIGIVYEFFRII